MSLFSPGKVELTVERLPMVVPEEEEPLVKVPMSEKGEKEKDKGIGGG